MTRLLLTTVYRPFCTEQPYDSVLNDAQHGACHRQFTREQGIFTIHQQCFLLALHLIAANNDAHVDVVEYPTLDALDTPLCAAVRRGEAYDYVGITCTTSYVRKARAICEVVKRVSPS